MTFLSIERKRSPENAAEDAQTTEEQWNLKDTIFVEDVRNVPVGRVLKVRILNSINQLRNHL